MASASGKKSTYVDDYFITDVYTGTGTLSGSSDSGAKTITNSIDYSEGALTWCKQRSHADSHQLYDTVRGDNKRIYSDTTAAEHDTNGDRWGLKFNSNGYTIGNACDGINVDGRTNVGWTFRKQKGFFDIVSYTGTGSAHSIAHNLGSVPGCIIIKNLGAGYNWCVYHSLMDSTNPANYSMQLDMMGARSQSSSTWNDTAPTSTHFTVGTNGDVNTNGSNFIAYLFAGSNATRWSDMLSPASGTFDFPAERAFNGKLESNPNRLRTSGNHILVTMTISPAITIQAGQSVVVYGEDAAIGNPYSYNGTATVTIDGTTYTSSTGDTHTFSHSGQLTQVTYRNNSTGGRTYLEGIRVNGDLLTDGSFFVNGNPNYTAGEESKFGEDGDQSIVKCGNFVVSDSGFSNFDTVNLGWEPQWILEKPSNQANTNWCLYDTMRGINYDKSSRLEAQSSDEEEGNDDQPMLIPTATGFKVRSNNADTRVYIAIRRPDGYVGKPAEVGTEKFAMAYGSTTNPSINGGIPIDFAMVRRPATTENWYTGSRLTGPNKVYANLTDAMTSQGNFVWDYMDGWQDSSNSNYLSWMWKRGQGFDVVNYKGTGSNNTHNHSLNSTPQMMWVKRRDSTSNWYVYHSGLNGGSGPQNYFLQLDTNDAEQNQAIWNNAPTSSVFSVSSDSHANTNNADYIAMLFASVDGISKVGYYDGGQTSITTGFQPRFLIIKRTDGSDAWWLLDTVRGWAGGNDAYLAINQTNAQWTDHDFGQPTSTGFTLTTDPYGSYNYSGHKYIYYAHA